MATETERLERETEETRAQLEQTLGELRARMSPGQLFDQATDYFRNSGGRTYLHNLREEVVHNPVPITLIGAGIAWLALSGAMGRRGAGKDMARDWGRTAGIADDLAHDGRGPSAMRRAQETAQSWAHEAGEAISETEERWRERADDVGDRVSTAYDETVGRARETTDETRERLREGAEGLRERAGDLYERTADGFRRVTRRASDYSHAARDAVRPDGALLNFCREQPMLVAGLGVAFGAAMAAMIPASRVERQAMGEASRRAQDRAKETASDTWRAVGGERTRDEADQSGRDQGGWSENRFEQAANDGSSTATHQSNIGRSEQPASAQRRERWDSDAVGSREAAADVERGVRQGDRASNIETEPTRAPYAEAAEAGAAGSGATPGEETKQRT
jgi:gas vesicle protein